MPEEKIKVLLVEDDPMIIDMYKMRLEEEGYDVLLTDKGSEAIELAEKEKPSIILLDIILPEIDGFSILQTLKSKIKTKNLPVLLLTNLGQETDQEKGTQMGAAGYFIKSQHTPCDVIVAVKKIVYK